jgi:hypothetical protein
MAVRYEAPRRARRRHLAPGLAPGVCHLSPATCHLSCVICWLSCVIYPVSPCFYHQDGDNDSDSDRARVCVVSLCHVGERLRAASSCAAQNQTCGTSLIPQFPERHVGCTGFPADSHDTIWMTVDNKLKNHRCPECGCGE